MKEQLFLVALGGTQLRLPNLEAIAGDPDTLLESGLLRRSREADIEFRHSLQRDSAHVPCSHESIR